MNQKKNREKYFEIIAKNGYSSEATAKTLEKIYGANYD